ncbi:MAG: ABC transporter permease subunit [Planctomycetes bacterium]|nr:ABC transporter permease subunit [Planctomycetota bacterium]MCB9891103.1 ABC transporter permease subunit [Planctomycetota bacterium]MCB9918871.1 ABC transporter permease subunit [Planctomycetota bacterium]
MIARKTWREVRGMTIAYFLILEALIASAILYWPEIAGDLSAFGALKRFAPGDFMKRMVQGIMDSGFPAYVTVQQFFKGINIAGIACAVLIGTGSIAGERENGTLDMLLSRPISRSRIFFHKWWVLALCVMVPVFLSSATIPWMELWIDPKTIVNRCSFGGLMHASWRASLFCLFFLTLTMLFSVFLREQVKVAFVIGGIIVLQVGMFFVQVLRHSSIFRLSDYDVYWPMMIGNKDFVRTFWGEDIWLILATGVLYAAAWWRFRRMDL